MHHWCIPAFLHCCILSVRPGVWPRAVTSKVDRPGKRKGIAGWLTVQGMTYGPAERGDASKLRCNVLKRRILSCVVSSSLSRALPFRRA